MDDAVLEGNYVVLMKSFDSGNMKIVPAKRNTVVHYGKLHFDPSSLIGAKYGSVFEITKDKAMIEVQDFDSYSNELSNTLSANSCTFNEKSQFSQEKMIRKKKKLSYSNVVTVVRPTLLLINEMLYARDKLGGLRYDSLAQILTSANVQNGSKCLLLDHGLGMLTSAIVSRILPDGICIQLVADNETAITTRNTLGMLNIKEDVCRDKLFAITVRDFYKVARGTDSFSYENEILRARVSDHQNRLSEHIDKSLVTDQETDENIARIEGQKDLKKDLLKRDMLREARNLERIKAASYLNSKSLDCLILIAQHDDPLPLLKLCLQFLSPSRQFVIYCDTVNPLLVCYQYLKVNSLAVSINLSESWLRKYQVLSDRTRPEMNVSGYGGYLLSGIKVQS